MMPLSKEDLVDVPFDFDFSLQIRYEAASVFDL